MTRDGYHVITNLAEHVTKGERTLNRADEEDGQGRCPSLRFFKKQTPILQRPIPAIRPAFTCVNFTIIYVAIVPMVWCERIRSGCLGCAAVQLLRPVGNRMTQPRSKGGSPFSSLFAARVHPPPRALTHAHVSDSWVSNPMPSQEASADSEVEGWPSHTVPRFAGSGRYGKSFSKRNSTGVHLYRRPAGRRCVAFACSRQDRSSGRAATLAARGSYNAPAASRRRKSTENARAHLFTKFSIQRRANEEEERDLPFSFLSCPFSLPLSSFALQPTVTSSRCGLAMLTDLVVF